MPRYGKTKAETPYGFQPVRVVLFLRNISQKQAAEDIGVPWVHFRRSLTGRTHPSETVRQKLPQYLGVPLEELFTAELLAKPYVPRMRKS